MKEIVAGEYFIDRDPVLFRYILNYLRDGDVSLPRNLETNSQLLRDCQFYGLVDLEKKLLTTIQELQNLEQEQIKSSAVKTAMETPQPITLIGEPNSNSKEIGEREEEFESVNSEFNISCYICKARFDPRKMPPERSHKQLCSSCFDLNQRHRNSSVQMSGMVCIVTGGFHHLNFSTHVI
jgi:hypothetical protein